MIRKRVSHLTKDCRFRLEGYRQGRNARDCMYNSVLLYSLRYQSIRQNFLTPPPAVFSQTGYKYWQFNNFPSVLKQHNGFSHALCGSWDRAGVRIVVILLSYISRGEFILFVTHDVETAGLGLDSDLNICWSHNLGSEEKQSDKYE